MGGRGLRSRAEIVPGRGCPTAFRGTFVTGQGRSDSMADRQLPRGEQVFLDHVAHFVQDRDTARAALARAGFAPTPVSIQANPDPAGGAPTPTGTGNVTAMFARGYVEVLFR